MWPPPPPMRHPSQFIGGPGCPPPLPVFPSRELAPMEYPPGPSAALHPHLAPPPLAAAGSSFVNAEERSMPPWHRQMVGGEFSDSWKMADSSWRQPPRQFGPYSNHEFYRQQYAQLPLSRPHPNFHPAVPPLPQQHLIHPNGIFGLCLPVHSFEHSFAGGPVAIPPEYAAAARADYERRLREQCEETRAMNNNNNAANFCDFSRVASERNGGNATGLRPEEGAIELLTQPSARRIRIKWSFKMPEANDKLKLHLAVRLEKLEAGSARVARGNELGVILDKIMPIHITHSEFNALPGSSYRIDLRIIDSKDNQLASATVYERAIFSPEELKVLMQKAVDFTGTEMQPFTYLYRCKPKIYWDYVINETRAEMNPYEKDSNGQAASPINLAISGLFFSARLDPKGQVPTQSPFGDVRFMLPASMLLQPHLNLYFADFYCNTKPHYVTVVVCREFSDIDRFCRRTCIPLAPFDNPFLLFQPNNSPTVPMTFSAKRNVWVEIYYTDNVPLAWGQLHHISTFGVGTSKIGGLPHNKSCRACNLYPQGPSGDESVAPLPEHFEQIAAEKTEQMVREAEAAELVDEKRDGNWEENEGEEEEEDGQRDMEQKGAEDEQQQQQQQKETNNNGAEEGGQRQQQVPFNELQNRFQQIECAVVEDAAALVNSVATDGASSTESSPTLSEFVQKIGGFLLEMHNDFTELNTKIDAMELIISSQRSD